MSNDNQPSDGCTYSPDLNFKHCCVEHDAYYGDASISRKEADDRLFFCILKKGIRNPISLIFYFLIAFTYWAGVRIFGGDKYAG